MPLSPLLRGESLVHALSDSRSKVIVVAVEFHGHIEAVSERLEHLERIVVMQSSKAPPESAFEIVTRNDLIGRSVARTDIVLPQPEDQKRVAKRFVHPKNGWLRVHNLDETRIFESPRLFEQFVLGANPRIMPVPLKNHDDQELLLIETLVGSLGRLRVF